MESVQTEETIAAKIDIKPYVSGYVLSVILTVIAFYLVMNRQLPESFLPYTVMGLAVVQILVHLHFFLHLSTRSGRQWNLMALLLTLLIIILFVGGSLWIMAHLQYRVIQP